MDTSALSQLIGSLGFPIACCCYLFYSNSQLVKTIDSLKDTIAVNTTVLETIKEKIDVD